MAPRPEQTPDLQRLIDLLIADEDLLLQRGAALTRLELPPEQQARLDELLAATHVRLRTMLERLTSGRTARDDEQSFLSGRRQAEMGFSVSTMLRSARHAYEVLQTRAHEHASSEGFSDTVLLRFLELVNAWLDGSMVVAVAGHREAELELMRQEQHDRANLLRGMLAGTVPPADLERLLPGLVPAAGRPFFAVRARPTDTLDTVAVERYLLPSATAGAGGLVAEVDGDICGFVVRLPSQPAPVSVGIAGATGLADLPNAFRQATRALETALAIGEHGLLDLAALGLQPAVLADTAVGEALRARYVEPVERGTRSRGAVILDTVEAYLDANSRLDVTARRLWVHVNTVRYRISRFEQIADCSLRDTKTLVEVWWALRHRRLTSAPAGAPSAQVAPT